MDFRLFVQQRHKKTGEILEEIKALQEQQKTNNHDLKNDIDELNFQEQTRNALRKDRNGFLHTNSLRMAIILNMDIKSITKDIKETKEDIKEIEKSSAQNAKEISELKQQMSPVSGKTNPRRRSI